MEDIQIFAFNEPFKCIELQFANVEFGSIGVFLDMYSSVCVSVEVVYHYRTLFIPY